ncbi:putative acyl-activating enzyme 5 [Nymphaea thermarum]|nr:putative acyl-activating enzyme 5 [Nymphaea thermarum]
MDQLKPSLPNSPPLTPLTFLERAALVYGDCTSIVYNGTSFTWSQTLERCLRLASSLSSLGIGRGDVVSVISPNIPAMYEMHFAVPMSGAIFNSINARLDARTISVILLHSESKLVIVDYQFLPVANEALALVSAKTKPSPKMVLIKEDSEDDDDLRPRASGSRPEIMATYEDLVKKGDPNFKWVWPLSEWTPMVLNYTSGTTSDPKGVVHCHRGLFIMTLNSLIDWGVTGQPVYLWTLPMFHANGWSFPWGMAALGGTNVCLRRFEPGTIFSAIAEHKVTHMCGAPVVLNMISNGTKSAHVEVESILYTHPAINEAAIVARPDEYWGETPCAFVSLKPEHEGQITEADIISFCRQKLPHYMVPKTVLFEELPKTSTGKIQKFILRQKAKALGSSRVSIASRI